MPADLSDRPTVEPGDDTRYVIVTGGVASATGKGITAASLALLLKQRGLRVAVQKLDPYLNVDPGTMNPIEHGEVFVTDDGGETDLDLGHYERFVDLDLTAASSVSSGQVWSAVIEAERRGDYLGKTVQVVPHVTNHIMRRILQLRHDADVVIVEIGGTVGDIEGLPFLEAVRQLRGVVGRRNVALVHVALVPWIAAAGELKSKPAQHSVRELRSVGLHPDAIVLRADRPIDAGVCRKIAMQCDVDADQVIPAPDADSLYRVPLAMRDAGLDRVVTDALGLPATEPDMVEWERMCARADLPSRTVTVAIVGKYVALADAYLSVVEALNHAGIEAGAQVGVVWVDAEDLEDPADVPVLLDPVDAIIVPGGFGDRGTDGKLAAIEYARLYDVPLLGICLGLQLAVVDAARAAGLEHAHSIELDPDTPHPVVALLDSQQHVVDMGGTMRLGAYPAALTPGSKVAELYGAAEASERHRHRYEVNPAYIPQVEAAGLQVSGTSPDGTLVEFVERPDLRYFVATQAHPELKSRPTRPHPLFVGLLTAAMEG